jgi:acetolactate synthase-1/3 small subunit
MAGNASNGGNGGTNGFMALRLTVNNHPGVMSHVCGLFARRAFNVEGILVTPQQGGDTSRIWLVVKSDQRLGQMIRQVRKLYDVLEVLAFEADAGALERMDECMAGWEEAGPCSEAGL